MIKLIAPADEAELCLIRGLLDAEGIPYFVQNDHFGSLWAGPWIDINAKTVFVPEAYADQASQLVQDALADKGDAAGSNASDESREPEGFVDPFLPQPI